MPAYFNSLRVAANSAAAPASRAASETYDSARGQDTVTSQLHLTTCRFATERVWDHLPVRPDQPDGLFGDGNTGRGKATSNQVALLLLLPVLLLPLYWFKWRCHANDVGALYSHNNSEEGSKKLAKTEPKQMCLLLLPKGGEGWNSSDGRW